MWLAVFAPRRLRRGALQGRSADEREPIAERHLGARFIERDAEQRRDHGGNAQAFVQRLLELGVGHLEPGRVEPELAALGEHGA